MIILSDSIDFLLLMVFVIGAIIWYCRATTTRTADTSIPMSRVLPHNYWNTSAT